MGSASILINKNKNKYIMSELRQTIDIFSQGRLGNALFKYFGAIVLSDILGMPVGKFITYEELDRTKFEVRDIEFSDIVNGKDINHSEYLFLSGFCQIKELEKYRSSIKQYVLKYPNKVFQGWKFIRG
jgi:hypothetical protein